MVACTIMPRRSSTSAAESDQTDSAASLERTVDRLTEEVRILRQAIDELRSEYEWALRQQRLETTVVRKMALDPLASDWNKRLKMEQFEQQTPTAGIRDGAPWSDLAKRLEDTIEAVGEGQLSVILEFLGGVRVQMLDAIAGRQSTGPRSPSSSESDRVPAPDDRKDAGTLRGQGSLF